MVVGPGQTAKTGDFVTIDRWTANLWIKNGMAKEKK